ncbi:50S ribosomal protein L28 [Engelhardtia mirabilis]|uniref:Large ribosomal subunit protein bL28 n=1 Tax=Engelhardtia mirabilis TaxID=2528011 RepID=A0A518BG18_9BACT|nr:50S ribosomal protein L28 [Planctomycetes bacterium Pla133]QDV00260.1 50S ribosomal protein L28 [Planctomycetes bacterium Pla86]
MARVCESSGKRTRVGGSISRRGLPKKVGGIGLNITGHTKRKFKPNIQKVRVVMPDGSVERLRLSTKVIKTGMINLERNGKKMRFPLVKAVRGTGRTAVEA